MPTYFAVDKARNALFSGEQASYRPPVDLALQHLSAFLTDTVRAVAFLTRIPVSEQWFVGFDGRYERASRAFPLAAFAITLGAAAVLVTLSAIGTPVAIAVLLALALLIGIRGALHEDGLADTFDGMGASDKDRKLAAMRDSATGVFGIYASVIVLLLRAIALVLLAISPVGVLLAWPFAAAIGGTTMVYLWATSEPITSGTARAVGRPNLVSLRVAVTVASVLGLPVLVLYGPIAIVAAVLLCSLVIVLLRQSVVRPLGGHTGDVLGAAAVLGETAVLVALATSA